MGSLNSCRIVPPLVLSCCRHASPGFAPHSLPGLMATSRVADSSDAITSADASRRNSSSVLEH